MAEKVAATPNATVFVDPGTPGGHVVLTFEIPKPLYQAIASVQDAPLGNMATTFRKALALYITAIEARKEGKHIGAAADADALDVEFVGF